MHVCFLTHEYPLPGVSHGGVGTFVRTLGRKLAERGHRVSVVGTVYRETGCIMDEGVHVYTFAGSKWKFASFIENSLRVNAILDTIDKKYPIQVVETPEIGLAFIRKRRRTRYVIRMHGGHHFFTVAERRPREKWKVFQEKVSFRKADGIAAVSNYVAQKTEALLECRPQVKVIYNPVNLQLFPEADPQKVKRNSLVFVGTVCEKKGVRQLIQALPLIQQQVPDVQLKIVGRDWKFPKTGKSYIEYLGNYIDPSIRDRVHFTGPVSNTAIPALLEEAEVCVFPSHMEAMPVAWIEALAMGKPVIGSREGPGPEAIMDGVTGLLADPYDPADISKKVIYMLQHKAGALEMGSAARKDIFRRFDIDQCVHENEAFYEQLTSE